MKIMIIKEIIFSIAIINIVLVSINILKEILYCKYGIDMRIKNINILMLIIGIILLHICYKI